MTDSVRGVVAIDDVEALKLGFLPGCIGVPTVSEGAFVLIGLSSDRSKVMFSPDTYRCVGKRLVRAGTKTYNEVGMITGLDLDTPMNRRLRAAVGNSAEIRSALSALRRALADLIGGDIVGRDDLPAEFRVINAALQHKAAGRKDHARLVLRWPWLFTPFSEHPEILDKAVAGQSLWDLIPEKYDPETMRAMKKIRKFDATWVGGGLPTLAFIEKLVASCSYIPEGGQMPMNGYEANALVDIVDFYNGAFGDFPARVKEMMKCAVVARGENWRGGGRKFAYGYARDYVAYLYRNILVDCFRLLGVAGAPADAMFAAAVLLFGTDPKRIIEASKEWHKLQWNDRALMDRAYGQSSVTEATSWASAIDTIRTPNGLIIVPLDSADDLAREGRDQHHCVYSQRRDCTEGRQRVASVRRVTGDRQETLSTFSFRQTEGKIMIREHRAFANGDPSDEAKEAVFWFEDECNSDTTSFRLNLDWPQALPGAAPDLRDTILRRFEDCKATLPKKLQKGGLDALLAVCEPQNN